MKRTYVKDLKGSKEKEVLVKGWIYKIYELPNVTFVKLRDSSGIIQIVLEEKSIDLKNEMSIEITGSLVESKKAPGGIEILASSIKVLGNTYYDILPFEINKKKISASLETVLDNRSVSLRKPELRAVFKIQQEITNAFREYLMSLEFTEIHTPKIISSSTEGGSEMFTVNYFDRRAFLAQSPQFYKQMMVGAGFERVFEVAPAYRAELHNTYRHLNEYISLDVEMGFIESYEDLMEIEEGFLKHLFKHINEKCQYELELLGIKLKDIKPIPRIPLAEVHEILKDEFGKSSPPGNIDGEGEVLISKWVKEKYDSDFVFLTKYPVPKRPMYAMPSQEDKTLTDSFDLIYKGLEITTGGQRIHDYNMLKENIIKFGLEPEDFKFYLDTFKYGMPPHGGFAIGLERITMKILDLDNIREATLLPRDIKRLEP